MANTVPNPLVLCDPLQVSTGRTIRAQQLGRLAGVHNWMLADLRAAPLVSQTWDASICRYESAGGLYVRACRWRVPVISDAHTSMRVLIYASSTPTGAGGSVRFYSSGAALSVAVAVAAGSTPTAYSGILTTAAIAASDYDDIDMEISAVTGSEVTVHQVLIQPEAVVGMGANLPASLIDGLEPMGISSQGADYPLSSAMVIRMRDAAEQLLTRPRSLFCWSGLGPSIVSYSTGAAEYMQSYLHASHIPPNAGDLSEFTVWTWCQEQGAATVAYLDRWRTDIGAGAARVWAQPGAGQTSQRLDLTGNLQRVGERDWRTLGASNASLYAAFGSRSGWAQVASISAWGR